MTRVDPPPLRVDSAASEPRPVDSAAERLQQRLEWERAFLDAQPRQQEAPSLRGRDAEPGSPVPTAAADAPSQPQPALPEADAAPAGRSAADPVAAPANPPALAAARVATPAPARPPVLAPRAAELPARPAPASGTPRSEVSRARAADPPSPPPREPERAALGVFQDEEGVRLWLRDAGIDPSTGTRLAQRLRRALAKLGLHLSSFTLNGSQLLRDASVRAAGDRAASRDPDRDLDITC